MPNWSEVVAREYHQWDCERIVIDTARESVESAVAELRALLVSRTKLERPANF